ncbi:MAG: hypothetical protein KGS48_19000 [Bacteroidetes bacterium]|nr:hypothetical protein [Bacteroidota bacterium]
MQFYSIHASSDLKIIGKHYPQLDRMFAGYNALQPWAAFGLLPNGTGSPYTNADDFKLKYHAKVTDWISGAAIGFPEMLISKRFFELLCNFNCPEWVIVDATVNHKDKILPYKYIRLSHRYATFINLRKSKFKIVDSAEEPNSVEQIIKSPHEIEEIRQRLHAENMKFSAQNTMNKCSYLRFAEVYLDEQSINKDFFSVPLITKFLISERLKEAIEAEGINGVQFKPFVEGAP